LTKAGGPPTSENLNFYDDVISSDSIRLPNS
jgi:hypothetical protein